mgnify:CR=1 FL=1|tara:strand:+ start:467 stop:724 length:258 start_codon:yes stop_codon:yes gene_type:complete
MIEGVAKYVDKLEETIEYYNDYKKRLCQLIIVNCCYKIPYSSKRNLKSAVKKRIHFTTREMTALLKELQEIEVLVHDLKTERSQI